MAAQMVKFPPAMQETQVRSWVGKIPWRREWLLIQYPCLENPKGRGVWWATVHGVTKSQTQLSD